MHFYPFKIKQMLRGGYRKASQEGWCKILKELKNFFFFSRIKERSGPVYVDVVMYAMEIGCFGMTCNCRLGNEIGLWRFMNEIGLWFIYVLL